MNHSYLKQFLFALFLSLGILFGHTSAVLAEENPEITENQGSEEKNNPVIVENNIPEGVDFSVHLASVGESEDYSEDSVTKEDVEHALSDAGLAEAGAVIIAQPAGGETSETIVDNELGAVLDETNAQYQMDAAEEIMEKSDASEPVQQAEEVINTYDQTVETATETTSQEVVEASNGYAQAADDALENTKNAETKSEAEAYAAEAKEAYDNAEVLYNNAEQAVAAASAQKEAAQNAYEAAKQEYEAALANAQNALGEGSEALAEALQHTLTAFEAAQQYYDQALIDEADAIAARDAAKADFDVKFQAFEDALKGLGSAIGDSSKEVIQNTGETVVTGIGYGISELVANYYDSIVEHKEELIKEYKAEIVTSEKTLAVELQSRISNDAAADPENKLSPEEKDLAVRTLSEIIIRDRLRQSGIEDARIYEWDIKDIDGVVIETAIDEGHKNGIFFSVKDEKGEITYYVCQVGDYGNITYSPVEPALEVLTEPYPDIEAILEDAETHQNVLGADITFGKTNKYIATDNNGDVSYEIYALSVTGKTLGYEYDYQKIYLVNEEITREMVVDALKEVVKSADLDLIWRGLLPELKFHINFDAFDRLAYSTDDLQKEVEKGLILCRKIISVVSDSESEFNSLDYVHRYVEEGYMPSAEMQLETLAELTDDYQSLMETEAIIAQLDDEINGDVLDELIVVCLDTFVDSNLNKIVSELLPSRQDGEESAVMDAVAGLFGSIDWSNFKLSNIIGDSFSDTLANIKSTASASILDAVKGLFKGNSESSLTADSSEELAWDFMSVASKAGEFLVEKAAHGTEAEKQEALQLEGLIVKAGLEIAFNKKLSEETIMEIIGLFKDFTFTDKLNKSIADNVRIIMKALHHAAYEDLKESIASGEEGIKTAFDEVIRTGKEAAEAGIDLAKAEGAVIGAKGKSLYAEVLQLSTLNAWMQAANAASLYDAYVNSFHSEKLKALTEQLEAANAALETAVNNLALLQTNRDNAKLAADEAKRIADGITDYDIWVSGQRVSSKNKDDVLNDGKVSYDSDSNTLTLKEARLHVAEVAENISAAIFSENDLNIDVKKYNKISASESVSSFETYGIFVNGDLTINGKKKHPVLDIDLSDADGSFALESIGIYTAGTLDVNDVRLKVQSGDVFHENLYTTSAGILSNDRVNLTNAEVTAEGGVADFSYGAAADEIHLDDSTLEGYGNHADYMSAGILAKRVYVHDSAVTAKGGSHHDGYFSAGIMLDEIPNPNEETSGLYANGLFAANRKPSRPEYYLKVSGTSSVIAKGGNYVDESYGIYCDDETDSKLLVKDNGSVTAAGGTHCSESIGIHINEIEVKDNGSIIARTGDKEVLIGYGMLVSNLVLKDHANVAAEAWGFGNEVRPGVSCGIGARESIVLNQEAKLTAESKKARNAGSYGILCKAGTVIVNDRAHLDITSARTDFESFGLVGDLIVNGDKKNPAVVSISSGPADDQSVGLYGDLTADGNFAIIIDAGSDIRKSGDTAGIIADKVRLNGKKDGDSYLNVYSGKAKNTSNGIIAADGLYVKNAAVNVESDDAGKRSVAIAADIKAGGRHGSAFEISARSGDAEKTYGIYGDIEALGKGTDVSTILVISGSGIESYGIYNEKDEFTKGSDIYVKKASISAGSEFHESVEDQFLNSAGIYANELTAVHAVVCGFSCVDETGEQIEEYYDGISDGIRADQMIYADRSEIYGYGALNSNVCSGISTDALYAINHSIVSGRAGNSKYYTDGIYVSDSLYASESMIEGRSGNSIYGNTNGICILNDKDDTVIICDGSTLKGYSGNLLLNQADIESGEEPFTADSTGIYIENELVVTNNCIVEGIGGSANLGRYAEDQNMIVASCGIEAGAIYVDQNSTVSGLTPDTLLAADGEEILAEVESYGICVDEMEVSGNSTVNGNSSAVVLEDTESDQPLFPGSYGISAESLRVNNNSTVTGMGNEASLFSIGIEICHELSVEDNSQVYGIGGTAPINTGIYFSDNADVSLNNSSSVIGTAGNNSNIAFGIYNDFFTPVRITLENQSEFVGFGGSSCNFSYGISGSDVTLTVRDSTVKGIGFDAIEESAGIYLIGDSAILLSGNAVLNAESGDAKGQSVGIHANIASENNIPGYFKVEASSGNADETYGIFGNLNLIGEPRDIGMASVTAASGNGVRTCGIYNETPDPEDEEISILGADISLQNVSLTATAGLASAGESEDNPVSAGIYANILNAVKSTVMGSNAAAPEGFVPDENSSSAGIMATVLTAIDSLITGNGGCAGNSYGIAVEGDLTAERSDIKGNGADDAVLGSYGISVDEDIELTDCALTGQGGRHAGSYGSFGILLSQDSAVNLTDTTFYGTGDDDSLNSYGIYAPSSDFTLNGSSSLIGSSGSAEKSSFGIFAGNIFANDESLISADAEAAEDSIGLVFSSDKGVVLNDTSSLTAKSKCGYGVKGGTVKALDHSSVDVAGMIRAFAEDVRYFFDGRDVRISDEYYGVPYTYWNHTDALSSDAIRNISIDNEFSEYTNTSGANQTWKKGSSDGAVFVFKNTEETPGSEITFDQFDGIWVDQKPVDPEHYSAEPGSVIITLKPSYLNTLSAGEHTLTAFFKDGKHVTSRFYIANADPAPTPGKKSSGGTRTSSTSSVVTCQMAGYPNGYAWNEAAKACQPGYIDANGVFHSYKTSGRYNTPNTADEGINPFYLLFLSMISAGALGYVFCKEN